MSGCAYGSKITANQAIDAVVTYGVSTMQPPATWIPPWSAYYEDNGRWKVQGNVEVSYPGGDYIYFTTWIYEDNTVRMEEIALVSSPPPPPQQQPAYSPPVAPPRQPNLALCQEYLEMSQHCHNEAMGYLNTAGEYQEMARVSLYAAQMAGSTPSPEVGKWLDTAQDYMDKADSLERESRMYYTQYLQCISQR